MDFSLTEEQELLRSGLTKFLSTRYDLEKSRAAAKSGAGWQPDIWRGFAGELGILGATLPEEAGGIGGGPVETMVIAEALGHALVVEPFIDTVVVAGGLLHRAGGSRAAAVLEAVADGSAIVALAAAEAGSGDNWSDVSTTAAQTGDGWTLRGEKIVVLGAPIATHLLVTARTSRDDSAAGGISLFLVDLSSSPDGIRSHAYRTIDDRRAADIVFDGLDLPGDALLGPAGQAWASIDKARDEGATAVCAEAVGAMRRVLDDTVEYCKQRHQFGVPIGSFQALQHRLVDMHMELEQSVAATYLAVLHGEAGDDERRRAVSAAKATIGRAARFIGQNAVQLHGGMGMTEELAIGHYFKRLTALQYEFGSTDHHLSRYAALTRP
ncbi:acyl-CoA dehydrogenase family protein [Mycobacterium sp. WMMD1722]|uniref:acyl-CoA dehydrogenase family protein n=1 Tax=Mycobacterium sp. WMMD1722 TaxID=3404117 RepID=UPI003BF608D7